MPLAFAVAGPDAAAELPKNLIRTPTNPRRQLVRSGERERLKRVLRDKLTDCGWRDDIKQRCRGERLQLAADVCTH
jgi:hypothetical protein